MLQQSARLARKAGFCSEAIFLWHAQVDEYSLCGLAVVCAASYQAVFLQTLLSCACAMLLHGLSALLHINHQSCNCLFGMMSNPASQVMYSLFTLVQNACDSCTATSFPCHVWSAELCA